MSKKLVLIVIVIFFLIGGGLGYYFGAYNVSKKYETKIQKAVEKLPSSGVVKKTPAEIFEFNGTIEKIEKENKKIFLRIAESPNPLEEWPLLREIVVNEQTKFYQRIVKDAEVYEKEKDDFKKGKLKEYPSPYFEKEITFNDLNEGDFIAVKSSKNIKFLKTIEAESILK